MALVDLLAVHEAGALVPVQVVAADGVERGLAGQNLDLFAAGEATEAVAVGDDHSAAGFDELGEFGIIHLGADEDYAGAERELLFRFAGLQLFQSFLKVGLDEVVRAYLTDEVDDVKLVAGDVRILALAEVAYLGDDAAYLVVILDRLAHCGVGHVHAEAVLELIDNLELELSFVVVEVGLVALHGRVDLGDEEAGVLDGVDKEEVLLHTLHGGAGLCTEQSVKVVVAALDGALEDGAGIGTGTGGHVVACKVSGNAAGCAQTA